MSPSLFAVYVALVLLALAGWVALRRRRVASRVRCALYHIPGPGGRALRIGITVDPKAREDAYRRTAWWWNQRTGPLTVRRWYPSTTDAHRVEITAIGRERPPHNRQHNPDWRRGHVLATRSMEHGHLSRSGQPVRRMPGLRGPVDGRRVRAAGSGHAR